MGRAPIEDALQAVHDADPDFVVIVAHATGDCEGECAGEMVRLARELDPGAVDLIVGGHSHTQGFGVANGVPMIRAGSSGRAIGVVDLVRRPDGSTGFAARVDTAYADRVTPDAAIEQTLRPFLARADSLAARPVAMLRDSLRRPGGEEYALGRLLADAVREAGNAQIGLTNRGGIRTDLPAGTVTYGDVFRVIPFDNTLWRFQLTGAQVRQVVEHAVRGSSLEFLSGIRVRYDRDRPNGRRVMSMHLSTGEEIVDDGRYVLATSDFLGSGGGGFSMLAGVAPEKLEFLQRDVTLAYLRAMEQPVVGPADARLVRVPGR
jgi:2',3'-cyclic-nucleotide 2'-phosphodiesterase (5'-nucleotidase family)